MHIVKLLIGLACLVLPPTLLPAQQKDSVVVVEKKVITLSEVIIRNNVNVPSFIERVKNDTSFYKAFRNLRVLQFTSLNDIRMFDKKTASKPPYSVKLFNGRIMAAVIPMCWKKK